MCGHAGARRVRIRIALIDGVEVCRVDVPAASRPIWARFKNQDPILFERRNNSTRKVAPDGIAQFIADRWPHLDQADPMARPPAA